MTDRPGEHPEPHADIDRRTPLIYKVAPGRVLYRIHRKARPALFFGKTGDNRFDAFDGSFGVLYAGLDEHCSFIETFGHETGVRFITRAALEERRLSHLTLKHSLSLVDLASSGALAKIGADARLFAGSHAIVQRWSVALRNHPVKADGILYPARHDPARRACAIFELPASVFEVTDAGSLIEPHHASLLGAILENYDFGLIDV